MKLLKGLIIYKFVLIILKYKWNFLFIRLKNKKVDYFKEIHNNNKISY